VKNELLTCKTSFQVHTRSFESTSPSIVLWYYVSFAIRQGEKTLSVILSHTFPTPLLQACDPFLLTKRTWKNGITDGIGYDLPLHVASA